MTEKVRFKAQTGSDVAGIIYRAILKHDKSVSQILEENLEGNLVVSRVWLKGQFKIFPNWYNFTGKEIKGYKYQDCVEAWFEGFKGKLIGSEEEKNVKEK